MATYNDDNLNSIQKTNEEMLDYFNSIRIAHLEMIQKLKTELFELNVKIEELEKTQKLYSFKSDNRRSLFSPIPPEESVSYEKGRQLLNQINDLKEVRGSLTNRIEGLEDQITSIQDKIDALHYANSCIMNLSQKNITEEEAIVEAPKEAISDTAENKPIAASHGYKLLMLYANEKNILSSQLDTQVTQTLINNTHKLEVLNWLLNSDIERARITLQELLDASNHTISFLEALSKQLYSDFNTAQPIWLTIDYLIDTYKKAHPDCLIDSNVDCTDTDVNIPPIIAISLSKALTEIFDNIFKHSNANKVLAKIIINSRMIDVYINDNGVGIPNDYLRQSKWSSGLHKLHELIYLLDGKLEIQGDLISGTNVRFSFPVKNNND